MNSSQQPNKSAIALFLLLWGFALPARSQLFRDRPSFFEEGNRQLEREIQTLQESSSSHSVLTINAAGWQWQKFVSTEGDFSIWMPTEEIVRESWEIPTSMGILKLTAANIENEDYFFMAAVSQPETFLTNVSPEVLLVELRDRLVENVGTTPTRETVISFADYPGRELVWIEEDEANAVRFYQIGERIYILGVGLESAKDISQTGRAFFDSFELL